MQTFLKSWDQHQYKLPYPAANNMLTMLLQTSRQYWFVKWSKRCLEHRAFAANIKVDDLFLHSMKQEHTWSGHFLVSINSKRCSKRYHETSSTQWCQKGRLTPFCVSSALHIPASHMPSASGANLVPHMDHSCTLNCQKSPLWVKNTNQLVNLAKK